MKNIACFILKKSYFKFNSSSSITITLCLVNHIATTDIIPMLHRKSNATIGTLVRIYHILFTHLLSCACNVYICEICNQLLVLRTWKWKLRKWANHLTLFLNNCEKCTDTKILNLKFISSLWNSNRLYIFHQEKYIHPQYDYSSVRPRQLITCAHVHNLDIRIHIVTRYARLFSCSKKRDEMKWA